MGTGKEKSPKKKLIRVEGHRMQQNNPYDCTNLGFAFLNKTGDQRKQCNSIVFCRDYFLDIVCCHKTKGKHTVNAGSYTSYSSDPHIDFDKLRLLLFRDVDDRDRDEFRHKLFSGKRALNHLEELAGFSEKSKITTVVHSSKNKVWLLTGPKEWLYFPTLISMAILILRLTGKHGPINLDKKNPVDAFFENLHNQSQTGKTTTWGKVSNDGDVSAYLKSAVGHFEFTAKHWRKIFGDDIDNKDIWRGSNENGFYTVAGFVNWCGRKDFAMGNLNGNNYYKEAIPRFHKMFKQYKDGKL